MDIVVRVVPLIAVYWNDIGYRLQLEIDEMKIMEAEASRSGDVRSACRKMLSTWISSANGRQPKTWRTLLIALLKLDINCDGVIDVLKKESSTD